LAVALVIGLSASGTARAQGSVSVDTRTGAAAGSTPISLTATTDGANARITGDNQGFSVESADFAHGFLTKARMSQRLRTLGPHGVIRIGGYSMDLVWPALGAYHDAPAPVRAIGGTVDQSDLDNLKELLDDSGWKVTLGASLKSIIDPSQVTNPAKDPSPKLTLDQVVAEVKAASDTLGDDLQAVEVGNEYDLVTTLTAQQYYDTMKRYDAAIAAAVPRTRLKLVGPSANTALTNTRLDDFVTAMQADTSGNPQAMIHELSSHLYPGSHCGASNASIPALMSASTFTRTRAKLQGIMAASARLQDRIPMTLNESNSASCSGQPAVSNAYAMSLWSLDYLMQAAQSGVSRVQFHTNTAAVCGDFQPRASVNYPISYRYYGAFCADDQRALDANELSASPLYSGIWAFRQVPNGRFVDLDLADSDLGSIRAYGVRSENGDLTMVLINVQDPSSAASTDDAVTLKLPTSYQHARAVTLSSSAAGGLGSLDASAITLGGRSVAPSGVASGAPMSTTVDVRQMSAAVTVAPGTAQIITFSSGR